MVDHATHHPSLYVSTLSCIFTVTSSTLHDLFLGLYKCRTAFSSWHSFSIRNSSQGSLTSFPLWASDFHFATTLGVSGPDEGTARRERYQITTHTHTAPLRVSLGNLSRGGSLDRSKAGTRGEDIAA